MTLADALSKLTNLSLLTSLEKSKAYEMHSLVHVSVEAFLSTEEMNTAIEKTIKVLGDVLPDGGYTNRKVWEVYLPHVTAWAGHLKEVSLDVATIYNSMSTYLLLLGRYSEAESKAKNAFKLAHQKLGREHPYTLTIMGNLALIYDNQERLKEAELLGVQVLEARERVLGQEHPDILTSMGNLAKTYRNQGRHSEAEVLEVQVLGIRRGVLGQEHPDTLTNMDSLALIYDYQGWWKEAEVVVVQVLDIRQRVLGQEHPDTLTSISNLAEIYCNQECGKKPMSCWCRFWKSERGCSAKSIQISFLSWPS